MSNIDYKNASWDDMVFENQNKEYGAYVLRKLVNKHTLRGFLYTMSGFLVLMLLLKLNIFSNIGRNEKVVDLEMTDVILEETPPPVEAAPPPPPPPPPPPVRPTVKFVEMIAKKDEEVAEEKVTKVEETKEVAISTITQEGDKEAKAIITEEKGTGPVAQPEPEAPKEPEIFDRAEVMPGYPGGVPELMKFLQKNIRYPSLARENGLEGKVIVKFYVDTDGTVREPTVLKDGVGGGCGDEAIRVVKAMPKWTPGSQRGKPVKVYYTLPVTFKLQ
jgi:protein TonB